jgi:hypothetical protein
MCRATLGGSCISGCEFDKWLALFSWEIFAIGRRNFPANLTDVRKTEFENYKYHLWINQRKSALSAGDKFHQNTPGRAFHLRFYLFGDLVIW